MSQAKPYVISKWQVWRAFELVKANAGAAGIDKQTIADYEENLQDNLYKLWNRLSSGCYFPPAVKAVAIPKKTGGERILGTAILIMTTTYPISSLGGRIIRLSSLQDQLSNIKLMRCSQLSKQK